METNEEALLAIISDHLEVTERLLDHYIKLAQTVQVSAGSLNFELHPTLEEMRASTRLLHERVRAILDRK